MTGTELATFATELKAMLHRQHAARPANGADTVSLSGMWNAVSLGNRGDRPSSAAHILTPRIILYGSCAFREGRYTARKRGRHGRTISLRLLLSLAEAPPDIQIATAKVIASEWLDLDDMRPNQRTG